MKFRNILAGLAGATALNLLHEGLKHTNLESPRVDLLGEEALQKTAHYFGTEINDQNQLYGATLAGDVISNTIYYSMIGSSKPMYIWAKALSLGLMAGLGAIKLPQPMGLDESVVADTRQKQVLTVGYYIFGALVTATVLTLTRKKS